MVDHTEPKNPYVRPWLTKEVIQNQWLAFHSIPVFRYGLLLAYNMWCWNSCWVGSSLSFPVGISSNLKKEDPIGGPGTSIRRVPNLTGKGINTHTRREPSSILRYYRRPYRSMWDYKGPWRTIQNHGRQYWTIQYHSTLQGFIWDHVVMRNFRLI